MNFIIVSNEPLCTVLNMLRILKTGCIVVVVFSFTRFNLLFQLGLVAVSRNLPAVADTCVRACKRILTQEKLTVGCVFTQFFAQVCSQERWFQIILEICKPSLVAISLYVDRASWFSAHDGNIHCWWNLITYTQQTHIIVHCFRIRREYQSQMRNGFKQLYEKKISLVFM